MRSGTDHHHGIDPRSPEVRTEALEDLLVEKGIVDRTRVEALIERFENDLGPMVGARLVAKAWVSPEFRRRLLDNADEVLAAEDIQGAEIEHLESVQCAASLPGPGRRMGCGAEELDRKIIQGRPRLISDGRAWSGMPGQ